MKARLFIVALLGVSSAVGFYNPTLARWTTRDPIEEEDSQNLYLFVGNNPVANYDPNGMYTLTDAENSLAEQGVRRAIQTWHGDSYSDRQLFDEWLRLERSRGAWWTSLPKCPSKLCIRKDGTPVNPDSAVWNDPHGLGLNTMNHPGGTFEMRSRMVGHSANQCVYDQSGVLMTAPPAAGTADFYSLDGHWFGHWMHDLNPFGAAKALNRIRDYYSVRPSW